MSITLDLNPEIKNYFFNLRLMLNSRNIHYNLRDYTYLEIQFNEVNISISIYYDLEKNKFESYISNHVSAEYLGKVTTKDDYYLLKKTFRIIKNEIGTQKFKELLNIKKIGKMY